MVSILGHTWSTKGSTISLTDYNLTDLLLEIQQFENLLSLYVDYNQITILPLQLNHLVS